MRKSISTPNLTWVDIQNPTREDIQYLKDNFAFHPLVLEELIPPIWRTKVEVFPTHLFLVLHYPAYNKGARETRPQEVDIIVTPNTIVTSHYYLVSPIKYLFDKCNFSPETKQSYMEKGSGYLLFYILNEFWESSLLKLNRINKRLNQIEEGIFKGFQPEMLKEISFTKADITDFLRIVIPQGDIFESLRKEGTKFFGQEMEPYFSHLIGHWSQVKNDLVSYKETIQALEETNNSLLTHRTNQIIKVFTIATVIFLPLNLVTSLYGMNVLLPFGEHPLAFFGIVGALVLLIALMLWFFRKQKWL